MPRPISPPRGSHAHALSIPDIKRTLETKPESDLLWTTEMITCYYWGGYHPVSLGDVFKDGRYTVAHKLGWGNSATVWLAKDCFVDRWVALKILTAADSTSRRPVAALGALLSDTSTAGLVPVLYDSFLHHGPNGTHLCLALELLGPSLCTVLNSFPIDERMDSEDLLRIATQLLDGVATLHEAGFSHGDLNAGNVVFTIHNLAHLPEIKFLEAFGKPETAALVRKDGKPPHDALPAQLVGAATWEGWIDEDEEYIRFVDVCGSFRIGNLIPSRNAAHGALRPPETLLTDTFDYRADLWSLGGIIYALILNSYPFMWTGSKDFLVSQMIGFVEDLPPEWEPAWRRMRETSSPPVKTAVSKIEEKFRDRVPEPELAPLLPVIQGLMRFRPEKRISAREALALLQ